MKTATSIGGPLDGQVITQKTDDGTVTEMMLATSSLPRRGIASGATTEDQLPRHGSLGPLLCGHSGRCGHKVQYRARECQGEVVVVGG